MDKKRIGLALLCVFASMGIYWSGTLSRSLLVIQYLLLAYGCCLASYGVLIQRIHHHCPLLYYSGVILMLVFTFLTLDTFLFHSLGWFPGILRYPLYSLYGIPYLVFCLPGWLLCYHHTSS